MSARHSTRNAKHNIRDPLVLGAFLGECKLMRAPPAQSFARSACGKDGKSSVPYMPQGLDTHSGTPAQLVRDVQLPTPLRCEPSEPRRPIAFRAIFWLNEGGQTSKLHYDTIEQARGHQGRAANWVGTMARASSTNYPHTRDRPGPAAIRARSYRVAPLRAQVLAQVDGVKEFVFIDPIDSLAIYKDHAPGVYSSPIDLQAVDLLRYPEVTFTHVATRLEGRPPPRSRRGGTRARRGVADGACHGLN